MKHWHEEMPFTADNSLAELIFTENSLFFDIETTGFSAARTSLYLIGCAARKENLLIVDQFFAETREFDTLKSKKVPQSLEIGLFFCQIFIFII